VKRFAAYSIMALAVFIGGGSLLLFGAFLIIGTFTPLHFDVSESEALLWDGILSLLFFFQHSGMMRSSFRARFASIIPRHYHPSIYAIASGVALTAVVFFWMPTQMVIYQLEGLFRFLARCVTLLAIAGFWWGVRSLEHFDTFGLIPIKTHLSGRDRPAPHFVLRGPYLWVRHPLYFFTLVLIWSSPDVSSDRLLFNVLWTLWIVLGAVLEEKDLVAEFGETYRHYQKSVPMLFPWRFPERKTIKSH
jgi:protein-S-isoprenylcysteine O-methyltransferase Ste14